MADSGKGVTHDTDEGGEQTPQGSNRPPRPGPPAERALEEAKRPSQQGDGDPGPDVTRDRESLQGVEGRSGSHAEGGARGEDEATE